MRIKFMFVFKIILFVICLLFISFAQIPDSILPMHATNDEIVQHVTYTLNYAETYEQAKWVMYKLTKNHLQLNIAKRENNFREDPFVKTGSALPEDYKSSGYDKGHLAPAANMIWSEVTMSESFYMSNISPQVPAFNRGIWKELENYERQWANYFGEIWVVTGPILKNGLPTIGRKNKISIPEAYFKIIFDENDYKMIGFVIPNKAEKQHLVTFVLSVDSIESLTNIKFFPFFSEKEKKDLKSTIKLEKWFEESSIENELGLNEILNIDVRNFKRK